MATRFDFMAETRLHQSTQTGKRSSTFRRLKRGLTWEELLRHIDGNVLFQVQTLDNKFWIEPFTGKRVPLDGTPLPKLARRFYQSNDYWSKLPLKSFQEVNYWRWTHYLQDQIRVEQRLRFFRIDGAWLNPFTGKWHDTIRRVEGRITAMTLNEIAKALGQSVLEVNPLLKPFEELRRIIENSSVKTREKPENPGPSPAASAPSVSAVGQALPALGPSSDPKNEAAETTRMGKAAQADAAKNADEKEATKPFRRDELTINGTSAMRARRVQQHMLGQLPKVEGFEIAAFYHPQNQVSGDFYEFLQISDTKYLMAVGDVTGHGVQAALVMSMALKTIRMVSRDQPDIATIARRLNDEIKPDLMPDQFISLFLGLVDTEERRITALCCGHHPALIINSEGEILLRRLGKRGGAIGIADSARLASTWNPSVLDLRAGDIVLQFTDGINETMTPNGQEFGMPRVHASLLANLDNAETLSGYIEELVDDVIDFGAGKIQDDITILAFRVRE